MAARGVSGGRFGSEKVIQRRILTSNLQAWGRRRTPSSDSVAIGSLWEAMGSKTALPRVSLRKDIELGGNANREDIDRSKHAGAASDQYGINCSPVDNSENPISSMA